MPHSAKRLGSRSCSSLPVLALLLLGVPVSLGGQEVPLDRWLVTGADPGEATDVAGRTFPDRDVELGPGYWSLLRYEAGGALDLADGAGSAPRSLAHAYLRADRDVSARLTVTTEPCADASIWLNGQRLDRADREVRLASGWNTLLLQLAGDAGCPRTVEGTLTTALALVSEREAELGPAAIRVQASRPPGIRPNHPDGVVSLDRPRIAGLRWVAGADDLVASVDYALVSWGRGTGDPGADEAGDRPTAPPAVDLTGEWRLDLYGPTGLQRARARLEMAADGTLTGRLERVGRGGGQGRGGPVLEGDVRNGWVSGDRFGWSIEISGRGRSATLDFRGTHEDGRLAGTIDFGGLGDFESRFEGRRFDENAPEGGEDAPRPGRPASEAGAERDPTEPAGEASGHSDPDGQLARMVRQIQDPGPRRSAAPPDGSVELRLAGERIVAAVSGLVPGRPSGQSGSVPFRKARDAALQNDGLEARIRWSGGDRRLRGSLSAAELLVAFHGDLALEGLDEAGDGSSGGSFRVPDALGGFTLRTGPGRWWVDGTPVSDGVLCAPCRRGARLEIRVEPAGSEMPTVRIADPGYPDAADRGPAAIEWLRAIEGDNRRYRELAGG